MADLVERIPAAMAVAVRAVSAASGSHVAVKSGHGAIRLDRASFCARPGICQTPAPARIAGHKCLETPANIGCFPISNDDVRNEIVEGNLSSGSRGATTERAK